MVFAFSGSHRSGKTTLARAVADDLGIEFHETRTGDVMKELGINMVGDMSLLDRIHAQEILLGHHLKVIADLPRPLIVDRCPIDMLAYTIAEVGMQSLKSNAELDARLQHYAGMCVKATDMHYCAGIICPPLPSYDAQDGKPPVSRAYQTHIHHLIMGVFAESNYVSRLILSNDNFESRRETSAEFICERIEAYAEFREKHWIN
jgi:predicted ATPase